jgi:molybdopterin-guanine dinucleotide biosynthesis protein A
MIHNRPSAAILAGGQATRFGGRDKSALLLNGRPILDHQIDALAPLTDDLLIVGGEARQHGHRRPEPRVVHDIVPGCGPLGGLHAALTAARGDVLLLVACDMPYLSSPFIAYLLSLAGDADVVVPQSERGYHPLCAVYARACLEPAAARLADRRLKMRELLDSLRTRVVPIEDIRRFGDPDRLLANVNTPADYADLEAVQGHKL